MKKTMKKLVATALALAMGVMPVLGLTACGKSRTQDGRVDIYLTYGADGSGHSKGDKVVDDNGNEILVQYRQNSDGTYEMDENGKYKLFFINETTIDGITYSAGEQVFSSEYGAVQEYVAPGGKATNVVFWINGNATELDVFDKVVKDFNEKYSGQINVEIKNRTSSTYGSALEQSLQGSNAPDVFYVGDSDYKRYARHDYLYDITEFVGTSSEFVVDDMWENVVERYKFDPNTWLSGTKEGRYYGVPKDLGPTVIFYNESYFNQAGITVISVDAADLDAFNAGTKKDDRGKSKSDYGINFTVKEKGFWQDPNDPDKYWFNNQVPMSWEETDACAKLVQTEVREKTGKQQMYGYFTEWWFNYGWSVGGNCVQKVDTNDKNFRGYYYDFTLMDDTPNYIVKDDVESVKIGDTTYKAGEIISYQDKIDMSTYDGLTPGDDTEKAKEKHTVKTSVKELAEGDDAKLNVLPSQRAAFTEFVRLAAKEDVVVDTVNGKKLNGYGITQQPDSIGGDAGKTSAFIYQQIAMLVDGRWNVTDFRKDIDNGPAANRFDWDVAPLPMYKEYDKDGNITVHGVEAGHSGSVSLCISKNCKVANAAWKFIEYVAGEKGQAAQAEAGFAIPLQKKTANSDVFLQKDKNPRNSKIFIDATEYEKAGDWWILYDNEWINDWASDLNGNVRNGKKTLTQFYEGSAYKETFGKLRKYSEQK